MSVFRRESAPEEAWGTGYLHSVNDGPLAPAQASPEHIPPRRLELPLAGSPQRMFENPLWEDVEGRGVCPRGGRIELGFAGAVPPHSAGSERPVWRSTSSRSRTSRSTRTARRARRRGSRARGSGTRPGALELHPWGAARMERPVLPVGVLQSGTAEPASLGCRAGVRRAGSMERPPRNEPPGSGRSVVNSRSAASVDPDNVRTDARWPGRARCAGPEPSAGGPMTVRVCAWVDGLPPRPPDGALARAAARGRRVSPS